MRPRIHAVAEGAVATLWRRDCPHRVAQRLKNLGEYLEAGAAERFVYILHHNLPDVQEEIRILEDLGVKVLTYPDEKFWSLIEEKTHRITYGKAFADYDSETPSFHNYGALLMLVPQLEVLDLGYNVIYFDVDIGLVQDPVPYITRGDADFTVSIEQRYCPEEYPSSRRFTQNWEVQEPNTGVMHVRATSQGVSMYRKWLRRIVQTNVRNDQLAFHRDGRIVQMDTVSNHWLLSPTARHVLDSRCVGRTDYFLLWTQSPQANCLLCVVSESVQ